ncbi:alpha,alpha-trehalose-phosphate synthase (UDP-forming) [Martelella alba]|uniref:Trehalose-6-phosphate synthase n=1 Tax=Martelella alba TaxID=2590451 RepID=A0ABY2SDZ6_9HYPH|nr:trehalose-6-phosphate synthase [Martelella alba]TKI02458.1 trehalose-6-phosphate synthase [Martelella alba]
MSRLIVLSNRSEMQDNCATDSLLISLSQIFKKQPGLWFGWNGGIASARKTRLIQHILKPECEVFSWELSPNEYDNYYQGYIHKVLWPVFHNRPDLVCYRKEFFNTWKSYNREVVNMVAPHIEAEDIIWVHDYHLLPSGNMLKDAGYQNNCGFFLHQPFPPGEIFRSVPEHDWVMQSLLCYDLIGFQCSSDINNFISYVLRYYRAERIKTDTIQINGRLVKIGIFPCGIHNESVDKHNPDDKAVQAYQRDIIISNDVISDISGIHYRLEAMRTLLNNYPQYVRDVSLLQITDPSHEYPYSSPDLHARLERFCGEINGQYGDFSWYPVNYIHNGLCKQSLIYALYRKAHVAMFTPLSEGMSMSAKEFILAQDAENPGVLILSEFTGAAEQLTGAITVNPYDTDKASELLHSALTMPLHERKRRHSKLLEKVKRYDCHWWAKEFITSLRNTSHDTSYRMVLSRSHYGIFTPQKIY